MTFWGRSWNALRCFSGLSLILLIFNSCQVNNRPEKKTNSQVYLEVLGIAQDAGAPQIGCSKNCCTKLRKEGVSIPVSSLGLVDIRSKKSWIFDATPDFPAQLDLLTQEGNYHLDGVFLTHAHIGHYTGLMYLGREALGAEEVTVHAMPRMVDFLTNNGPWSQLVQLKNITLNRLESDSTIYMDEDLRVRPVLVPHRDEFSETVGYWIEGPSKKALFIPDIDKWERWDKSILKLVSQADYAFIDATFYNDKELPGRNMEEIPHPFVLETMNLFKSSSLEVRQKVFLIHLNHTNDLLDKKSVTYREVADFGFRVAHQGLKLAM